LGFGLPPVTMFQPEVVNGFLQFKDWGLMWVMGGAAGLAMLAQEGFPRWFNRLILATSDSPSLPTGTAR
jgi:hypothetical protein